MRKQIPSYMHSSTPKGAQSSSPKGAPNSNSKESLTSPPKGVNPSTPQGGKKNPGPTLTKESPPTYFAPVGGFSILQAETAAQKKTQGGMSAGKLMSSIRPIDGHQCGELMLF